MRLLRLSILIVMWILTSGFGPPRLVDREIAPTQRWSVGELRRWAEVADFSALTAEAAIMYDVSAGEYIVNLRGERELPPASLTKLMTALLVLEAGDMDTRVTVVNEDLVGGATMGLRAGETLEVEELLWGLLLPSGNDAAMALARHVAGSHESFIDAMNERAQVLGLTRTHFENAHGLDAPGHLSSAADLLALTLQLWQYPTFQAIVATPQKEVAGRTIESTNDLLRVHPSANGVKTGTTELAGECLVASFQHNGHLVIVVLLGSRDRYAEAMQMYEYYRMRYRRINDDLSEISVLNRFYDSTGEAHYMRPLPFEAASLIDQRSAPAPSTFRQVYLLPEDELHSGAVSGTIEWKVADRVVGQIALILR